MFTNYQRSVIRRVIRHRLFSGLNIVSLAIGMAVALTIGLWAYYQYTFDRAVPGYRAVYQVKCTAPAGAEVRTFAGTALPLAGVLRETLPGVRYAVPTDGVASHGLAGGGAQVYLPGIQAGADFLRLFRYPVIRGDGAEALSAPYSIVLTDSTARAFFGTADCLGRVVRIDNEDDLKVSAVIDDLPANTTLRFSYIVPLSRKFDGLRGHWGDTSFQTFVALQPGADCPSIARQVKTILQKYSPEEYDSTKTEVFLQSMADWHLYTEFKNGSATGGMVDYVRLLMIIGVLVLAIACVNFMHFCISRREHLILLQAAMACCLALLLVQSGLPRINELTGCALALPYASIGFWLMIAGAVLISGGHPALVLSGFRPFKRVGKKRQTGPSRLLSM